VKATAGNTRLGGEDFDNRLVNHFVHKFERKHKKDLTTNKRALSKMRNACERAKRMLSVSNLGRIEIDSLFEGIDCYMTIKRDKFEELNEDLFRSTIKLVEESLQEAKMNKKQIDDVVLVGGSTRIPMVQKLLQDLFDGKELNKSMNRDEAVAYGAAVQAAILAGDMSEELQGLGLIDVNNLSLGIETDGGVDSVLIKRNTPIPIEQTNAYTTLHENQVHMSFNVYECEPAMTNNKSSLGKFLLTGIPIPPRGVPQIEVTFRIDDNGILNATAVAKSATKENEITVTNENGRLSNEEIERMKEDAERYRAEDEKQKQTDSAQNALELYCSNMKREIQDEKLKGKISESDKNTILDKVNEIFCWLDENQHAEKEMFDSKLKELESVHNQIMKKMECTGDMPNGMPEEFPRAGSPAPDDGEALQPERLESDHSAQSSCGEHHNEYPDTDYGGRTEENSGKQSNKANVRNLGLSLQA
jgi:L1 cell adhesion molecule like protein